MPTVHISIQPEIKKEIPNGFSAAFKPVDKH
jgi:hypothetical protein